MPFPSLIDVQPFLATIPLDTSSFALWLHENVPKFTSTVDEASAAIEDLCRADIMKADDDIVRAESERLIFVLKSDLPDSGKLVRKLLHTPST